VISETTTSAWSASVDESGFDRHLPKVLLPLLAVALIATNRWFTVIDDEAFIIDRAAKPARQTIHLFLSGVGEHQHPPLYDLLLHGWLRLTNGDPHLLRVVEIVCYVLGAWVLAQAAKRLGGNRSQVYVLWIVALWPYGFHFGRVAVWYSFCFLLVSLVTLCYLNFLNQATRVNWIWLFLSSVALVYSNYFGWALLACLALDFAIRNAKCVATWWMPFLGTGALLLIAYIPLFAAFLTEMHHGPHADFHALSLAANGVYNIYCLFVSESVAPWYWIAGVSAGLAIAVCLILTLLGSSWPVRRFLLYFASLFFVMTVLGVIQPKRVMLISPWLILALGVALATLPKRFARRAILASLICIAVIGWLGIFSRKLYAAPRWIEPWDQVAQHATDVIHNGGIVIGNNPSFFFYMTYSLPASNLGAGHTFEGLLPNVSRTGVFDPTQWLNAGRPLGQTTLLVKGLHFDIPSGPTDAAENWLDLHCSLENSEHLVHDPGAKWKQRFAPQTGQLEWRIEIRSYSCPR
jgi:hypothetical protein